MGSWFAGRTASDTHRCKRCGPPKSAGEALGREECLVRGRKKPLPTHEHTRAGQDAPRASAGFPTHPGEAAVRDVRRLDARPATD